MTVMRAFLGGLLLCGLAACDSDKPPRPTGAQPETVLPVPAPPAATTVPASEPAPVVPPAQPRSAPPAQSEPRATAPAVKPRRPSAPLDLSLPSEVLERSRAPDDVAVEALEPPPLLPPLFVDKAEQPNSFELGGKLITNEHPSEGEDPWQSVEGVELQLQFRH